MTRELFMSMSFARGCCLTWLLLMHSRPCEEHRRAGLLMSGTMLYFTNEALTSDDMIWPRALPVGGGPQGDA